MSIGNIPAGTARPFTATGNIFANGLGTMLCVLVATNTAGTISIYDSATTTTTANLVLTFTPASTGWYAIPITCQNGFYVVIGGTLTGSFVTVP